MDINFWNKLQPGIATATTAKQFHGRYLWRMTIHAEGGRLLDTKSGDLAAALQHRINLYQVGFKLNSYWRSNRNNQLYKVDLNLLRTVQEIRSNWSGQVRVRIEEPNIQFYAEDETTLKTVALKIDAGYIKSIMHPLPQQVELLRSGAIITRTALGYSHKVIVRDGRYSLQTKQQLLCYLDGLGDTVKLSKTARSMLEKPYESTWGVFFYTNDPAVVTFVSLIDPGLISNIHTMVTRDYK
jgi:hypothetical protein